MSMVGSEKKVHILLLSNENEEKSRYRKIITSINGIKNSISHFSTLTYRECRQGEKNLESYMDEANVILLLMSLAFVGSPQYQEEVEMALRKHRRGKVRVFPVLLSPIAFEEYPILGELQPLPRDRRSIAEWPSADEAVLDIEKDLRPIIYQIIGRDGIQEQDEDENVDADGLPASSTAFNWTESILPLCYLTLSGKDQGEGVPRQLRLRKIMRVLYERQEAFGEESLDELAIYEAVQKRIDGEYSLQDCQGDLKHLASKANLARLDDMSGMAYSISSFEDLTHKKFYQTTSDGIAIEKFVEERM